MYSIFAGFYHWFHICSGVNVSELLGKVNFISFFISSNLLFFPMQYTGIAAYPRRVCEYPISFHQLTKIECFGIKGLFIVCFSIIGMKSLILCMTSCMSILTVIITCLCLIIVQSSLWLNRITVIITCLCYRMRTRTC